jgi:hypothetical protein
MEKNDEIIEVKDDLFIRIKAKKTPGMNLPEEVTNKVTLVSVEVDEVQNETESILDLNIHVQSRAGAKLTKADAGKK